MTPVVEVAGLKFGFQLATPILKGISFTVTAGETIGILGANGAGKSSLLWCLLGLHRFQGKVLLFGEKPSRRTRSRAGIVFQNPEDMLFMPRVVDDLALPLLNRGMDRTTAYEEARTVLERTGLDGYSAEPASHLSLGQRKQAAIAASLVAAPELLLLDVPTAELDPRATRQLDDVLDTPGATRVITSHDMKFLRRTSRRLLVLDRGNLVADGPASAILEDRKLLEHAGLL